MAPAKEPAKESAKETAPVCETPAETFGEYVFGDAAMKKYLSPATYESLRRTIDEGKQIDPEISAEVAEAMKNWAVSLGATHYTHWFQPLTGTTAGKHEAFLDFCGKDGAIMRLSGKNLVVGEPDASSFPSDGARATCAARGYTAWDPTSPAFVKEGTLFIPAVFVSYTGETLDKKAPLLKSITALNTQTKRILKLFGTSCKKVFTSVGPEQEYFLVDKKFYDKREDLRLTGRTLFGSKSVKGQELEDHYFGVLRPRVAEFMKDLDETLWKYGILAKSKHNEVAPAQHELAPVFCDTNRSVDNNQLMMEIMKKVAEKHNLACLLHEKPFEGINGSGKHNNWSLCSKETPTFLELGDHPEKNLPFIVSVAASIRAVDKYGDLLRACVTSASNDHRLGGNEAPPAIMSMYLGEDVTNALEMFMKKKTSCSSVGSTDLNLGVCSIPSINREGNDRNRTSPFAFTVNKFEFRAVGSNQSAARSNMVINTIMADSFRYIADEIIRHKQSSFMTDEEAIQKTVTDIITKHNRIIFNGNGYSPEWVSRAQELGLPNNVASPEAIKAWTDQKNIDLFTSLGVMNGSEIKSRQSILWDQYNKDIMVEARTMCALCTERIIPTVFNAQSQFSASLSAVSALLPSSHNGEQIQYISYMSEELNEAIKALNHLKKTIDAVKELKGEERISFFCRDDMIPAMNELRKHVDRLESTVDYRQWPLPNYASMFFNQS